MEPFKLAITGAFNTGKTTFVRSLSEIEVVDTDRATSTPGEQKVKATTTVAMDYGRITVGRHSVQLFGTPGQARFDFMREILTKGVDGVLILLDVSDPATVDVAASLVEQFRAAPMAMGVVLNKTDLGAMDENTARAQLQLPEHARVYSCRAIDPDSARTVVRQFLDDVAA